ncbi:MAG: AAA family ATPase, partial [Clostridia bacterium]|nr:AAA family ATPase [Clostridia bacterium]
MRIKEITLKNFGKYKDVEKPLVFKEGVNVVYGLNEAGKSTLFNG